MAEPPPCDQDVYENGAYVFLGWGIPSEKMEKWVREVAIQSGQRVDWHWFGGRAVVKALGDIEKVNQTIRDLLPLYHHFTNASATSGHNSGHIPID